MNPLTFFSLRRARSLDEEQTVRNSPSHGEFSADLAVSVEEQLANPKGECKTHREGAGEVGEAREAKY